jgi:ATP-dependent Lon protease
MTAQTPEQAPQQEQPTFPDSIAVLPLKGMVVLPSMVGPLGVGRPKSLAALESALSGDRMILLVAQKNGDDENPEPDGLYREGTVCRIRQVNKQPDGTVQVIVEGLVRGAIVEFTQTAPFFQVRVETRPDPKDKPLEIEALMRGVTSQFERFVRLSRAAPPEEFMLVMSAEEPGRLGDLVAQHLQLRAEEQQHILEAAPRERLEMLSGVLTKEITILELERKIQHRVRKQMEKSQREHFLKEQMKAIQQELGEKDEGAAEGGRLTTRQYAVCDALATISGFVGAILLAIGTRPTLGAFATPGRHYFVVVREGWMLDLGLWLLVVSFLLQMPKVWRNLKRRIPLEVGGLDTYYPHHP